MNIWLVTVGEPLPTDDSNARLLRTGLLAGELVKKGHHVTWWTSTFNHSNKSQRYGQDTWIDVSRGYRIILLHGKRYDNNISLSRIRNHRQVANRFRLLARHESRPDVIVCSLPTLELSLAASDYGIMFKVPVVIDVRDLWPDIFVDLAPNYLKPVLRAGLRPLYRAASRACRNAAAIIGNSPEFLDWGLSHAGRNKTGFDRVFPFGYSSKPPAKAEQSRAISYWEKLGLKKNHSVFIACFFGTLGRQFDMETVIEAGRKLDSNSRLFRIVICGAGDRLDEYKSLAQNCKNILFPGWVGKAEIWALMQMSSVGLAPYISNQGFTGNLPNKPLEYMSGSLPVISSLSGYLAELLDESQCGITYRNGDSDKLACILEALYDAPQRLSAMSENAYALFQERFMAEKIYPEFVDYLEHLSESGCPTEINHS